MKRFRYWLTILSILGVLGLVLGCASAPPPVYYRLDYRIEAGTAQGQPLDRTLVVQPVRAPETLARNNILYRVSPRILQHYQSRFWEQSPAEATQQQLVRSLKAAAIFKQVTTKRLSLDADFSLSVNLTAFEEVLTGKQRSALVGMRYDLFTFRPKEAILSGEAESRLTIPGGEKSTPEALAETMSQALRECLDKIVTEVGNKVRQG